jgi:threonine 3-dehydrogenase
MKAIVKTHPAPGAELLEVPIPRPGTGEALVRVKAASICGTDSHIYAWNEWAQSRVKPPLIFGHEMAGEVVELGGGVDRIKVGDFVAAETHVVCGKCYQCMTGQGHICTHLAILGVDIDGVFAEYISVPEDNLWVTDPAIPVDWASVQEPAGNAVHTALSGDVVGKTVAVFGCGPIGLIAISVALACGADRVYGIDVNPYRLRIAGRMGAAQTINPREEDPVKVLGELTGGEGVDAFLEMSGAPSALSQGFAALRYGGRASLLGLPGIPVTLDVTNGIVFKGATVYGISGRKIWDTWYKVSSLLRTRKVDLGPVITHTLRLDQFDQGFELMRTGQCGKVILLP